MKNQLHSLGLGLLLALGTLPAFAQSTEFTYQGRLTDNGAPAQTAKAMRFTLCSDALGTIVPGLSKPNPTLAIPVTPINGLFTVKLDFGAEAFAGANRFLKVEVKPPGGLDSEYTILSPMPELTMAPHAIYASKSGTANSVSSVPWTAITGIPAGFADGIDNSTTYAAGTGLILSGNTFSLASQIELGSSTSNGKLTVWGVGRAPGQYIRLWPSGLVEAAGGFSLLKDPNGIQLARLYEDTPGFGLGGGRLSTWDLEGKLTAKFGTDYGFGGSLELFAADGGTGLLMKGNHGGAGLISVHGAGDSARVWIEGASDNSGGGISVHDTDGTETVEILGAGDASNQGGQITMRQANHTTTVQVDAEAGADGGGYVGVYRNDGVRTVEISGGNATSCGKVKTQVLEITGGCDLSEQFHINSPSGEPEPGMLVSIDPQHPGQLVKSSKAYDRTVAGIVSGAGGVQPGMLMGQQGWAGTGQHPVALTGRVYCQVDADHGAIQPGDLITTSGTPGHGMKATDHLQAQGAIIGKAMTALSKGKGLVLVLVSLQ